MQAAHHFVIVGGGFAGLWATPAAFSFAASSALRRAVSCSRSSFAVSFELLGFANFFTS